MSRDGLDHRDDTAPRGRRPASTRRRCSSTRPQPSGCSTSRDSRRTTSGERTNAPLLCFVLGRAVALGAPLDELDAAVRGEAPDREPIALRRLPPRRGRARSRSTATSTSCGAVRAARSAARRAGARTSTGISPKASSSATSSCARGHGWSFDCARPRVQAQRARADRPEGRHRDAAARRGRRRHRSRAADALASRPSCIAEPMYPPDRHLLRDLRLAFDHSADGTSRAWLPVVPEICGDDGAVRAGALATLVDVIGGGLAAATAQPRLDRDRRSHVAPDRARRRQATSKPRPESLRAGRTTVVLEVDAVDATPDDRCRDDELLGAPPPRHQPGHRRDRVRRARRRWRSTARA